MGNALGRSQTEKVMKAFGRFIAGLLVVYAVVGILALWLVHQMSLHLNTWTLDVHQKADAQAHWLAWPLAFDVTLTDQAAEIERKQEQQDLQILHDRLVGDQKRREAIENMVLQPTKPGSAAAAAAQQSDQPSPAPGKP
jgi:hypothetical protein